MPQRRIAQRNGPESKPLFKQKRKTKKKENHMPAHDKEELQERAQLIRALEATCKIDYPTPDESNFRIAIMKKLGTTFGLREMRTTKIEGPVTQAAQRPAGRGK